MKKNLIVHCVINLVSLLLIAVPSVQGEGNGQALPAKEKFHLFLLAGQSNMAGRGIVEPQDKIAHPRVLMLNQEGEWVPAVEPMGSNKKIAGVGPGRTFAIALAEEDASIVIGLIPAARGGSSITSWVPGAYHGKTRSHPYDDAIAMTQLAMEDGTLKGVLWHQGESDSKEPNAEHYKENLVALIARFRETFEDPCLPFIIGQLGQFPQNPWSNAKQLVNNAHLEVVKEVDCVGFVPSDGLTSNPDGIHFNASSQREFGLRYAEEYHLLCSHPAN